MYPSIQISESLSDATFTEAPVAPERPASATTFSRSIAEPGILLPVATASIAAHLILIAWFGAGIPVPPARIVRDTTPAAIPLPIEEIQLVAETPPPELLPDTASSPSPDAPAPAAPLDLPPLPQLQAIAAVPSTVAVAFGVEAKGPVRLVSDAAHASGVVRGRRAAEPVALDLAGEQNLLLPPISYPVRAKRQRLTGTALVEFRTSATGEIADVRIRQSSGHAILDQAAQDNLKAGRWKGQPGLYMKAYEFALH